MDIYSIIFSGISFLINEFLKIANTMITAVMVSFQSIITGFLNGFGIPFSTWANYLANQYIGFSIPIIFILVLGIAFLIFIAFIDIYGIEDDIGKTIGMLMKGIEEG